MPKDVWFILPDTYAGKADAVSGLLATLGLNIPALALCKSQLLESAKLPWSEGDVVVIMGAEVAAEMQIPGLKKKSSLETLRGLMPEWEGARVFFTLSPGSMLVDDQAPGKIRWDLVRVKRWLKNGHVSPTLGTYRWEKDLRGLIQEIEDEYEKTKTPVAVAMDLETMGLYPEFADKQIVCSNWSIRQGEAILVSHHDLTEDEERILIPQLWWLLTSEKVKLWGANLKYDLRWLRWKYGVVCSNFTLDIILAGSLLNENRSNSLKNLVKEYDEDLGGYEDDFHYDMGHMELVPKDAMLLYAGPDADGTLRCGTQIRTELMQDRRLLRFYQTIVHPAGRAFEAIEHRGIAADPKEFAMLRADLEQAITQTTAEAIAMLPGRIKAKYADNLSLTRAVILVDYFFSPLGLNLTPKEVTAKNQTPSTSIKHFQKFADHPEAAAMVAKLKALSSAGKTLSTYVDGFLKHLRPDGRFHPSYMLFHGDYGHGDESGTVTGRSSAKDPAIQTLPKKTFWAERLRRCYPAPPGKLMWEADFKQGELKVAACIAHEPNMLSAYAAGGDNDLHVRTAAGLVGMSVEDFKKLKVTDKKKYDMFRSLAKAVNFGLLYGMGAEKFQLYALDSYGVAMSLGQAEEYRHTFLKVLYPGLSDWHDSMRQLIVNQGFVRSPLGRIRHLPLAKSKLREIASRAQRQGINAPVQSTLTDLTFWAASLIEDTLAESQGVEIVAMVHDSLVGYIPEDTPDAWKAVVEVMEGLPIKKTFGWDHEVPFTVEMKVGPNLADMDTVHE